MQPKLSYAASGGFFPICSVPNRFNGNGKKVLYVCTLYKKASIANIFYFPGILKVRTKRDMLPITLFHTNSFLFIFTFIYFSLYIIWKSCRLANHLVHGRYWHLYFLFCCLIVLLFVYFQPNNILLTAPYPHGDIKLCDFGFARTVNSGDDVRDIIGTPDYVGKCPTIQLFSETSTVSCTMYTLLLSLLTIINMSHSGGVAPSSNLMFSSYIYYHHPI